MNLVELKKHVRDYGMYIALMVIMLLFTILTDGLFMRPRNISNLFDQTAYVAILAVGMTMILIIRHIDLSVGFVAGFSGAVAATLLKTQVIPLPFVLLFTIGVGILIGMYQGWLVAFMGVPSFVVSLAGMFIFRGALLRITEKTGTIIVENAIFNAIGNNFIPDVFGGSSVHIFTIFLGVLAVIGFIFNEIYQRKKTKKYGFELLTIDLFLIKIVIVSSLILYFSVKLAMYRGLSWAFVIVLTVVGIFSFFLKNIVMGRHIYAIGGNPEASALSGIKVKGITFFVFVTSSALASLAGIMYTSRLQSATTIAGVGFELDAIAAAYVGGVSASGGVGKVTGTIIGAIVMTSLSNGLNLMGVGISIQYVVRGLVLVLAVLFDVQSRRVKI